MSWYAAGICVARAAIPGRAVGDGDGDRGAGRNVWVTIVVSAADCVGVAVFVATGALQAAMNATDANSGKKRATTTQIT